MKKIFTLFSLLLLLVSTILPAGWQTNKVEAAEAEEQFEAGTYTIPVEFLHESEDKTSAMQNYVGVGDKKDMVDVTISEETNEVELTLTGANMIKDFGIGEASIEASSENTDEETRTYIFEVDDLRETLNGFVSVEVPNLYSSTHQIRIQFDTAEIPLQEAELEPGAYTIDYASDVATMNGYIDEAILIVGDNDENSLILKLNSQQYIENLNIRDGDSKTPITKTLRDGDFVYYQFAVSDIDAAIPLNVDIDAMGREMSHDFNVTLDQASAVAYDGELPVLSEGLQAGAYTVDYASDVATMNGYIDEAILIVGDNDENSLILKLNSQQYIENLNIRDGDSKTPITKTLRDGDFVYYQLAVSDIDTAIPLNIDIDAMGREMSHDFNVTLDQASAVAYDGELPVLSEGLQAGAYTVDYASDVATMNGYIDEAILIVGDNDENSLILKLNSQQYIENLNIRDGDSKTPITKTLRDGDFVYYQFAVSDIDAAIPLNIDIDAMGREMSHDFNVTLDQASAVAYDGELPELTEETVDEDEPEQDESENEGSEEEDTNQEEPEQDEPEKEDPKPEESDEESDGIYQDGEYDLPVTIYEDTDDLNNLKASSMDGMLIKSGDKKPKVVIKDGHAKVSMSIENAHMIKDFTVDGKNTKRKDFEAEDIVTFTFPVEDLDKITPAFIAVDTPIGAMEHDILIGFDTSKLKLKEGEEKPNKDKGKEKPAKNPKPEAKPIVKNDNKAEKDLAEGTYKLPIYIFKAEGDLTEANLSSMNEYVIAEKSSVYIQNGQDPLVTMVLKDADLITGFTVEGSEMTRLELGQNQAAFTFSVKDLNAILNGNISVSPPGLGDMNHDIRIAFDPSDIPGQDKGKNALGQIDLTTVNNNDSDNDGLDFDRFADGDGELEPLAANVEKASVNPKTNDVNYAKMMLFGLLFLISTVFLGLWLRSRFVKSA